MMRTFLFFVFVSLFLMSVTCYRVPLPRGAFIENIVSTGGGNFLMSDVSSGNVLLFNIGTGKIYTVVKAPPGRLIQGLAYSEKHDLILTAGSGKQYAAANNRILKNTSNVANVYYPPMNTAINIYKATSGDPFAQCNATGANLIKDVTVDRNEIYAYFTDAFNTAIYQLDLTQLPNCVIKEIPLPHFPEFDVKGYTYYTGVGVYRNGLIVNSYSAQLCMFVNPKSGKTKILSQGDGFHDGLKIRGNCLFAADAGSFNINVFRLYKNSSSGFSPSASLTGVISDPTFTFTTAMAFSGDSMVVANADTEVLGNTGFLYLTVVHMTKSERGLC